MLALLLPAGLSSAQVSTGPPVGAREDSAGVATDSSHAAIDSTLIGQRDLFDVLHRLTGKEVDPTLEFKPKTGLEWALLPTFSVNPVYGAAIGAMISGAGRRGSINAPYSKIMIGGNYSTTGQVQLQFRGDVFSRSEEYLASLDLRYLDTERSTWGLGPIQPGQVEDPMTFVLERVYTTLMRVVSGPVFTGLGFHFDRFTDIKDQLADEGEQTPFTIYSQGYPTTTTAVGLSFNVLGDTRDNVIDPLRGYLVNYSFRAYGTTLGSDENWQELWVEARVYPHLPKHSGNVLAFWLYSWMTFGHPPYLNLPANGWDKYGRGARGYLAGRIRGPDQIYMETEYRFGITRDDLWGAVVFVNGTWTTTTTVGTFGKTDYAGGAGLRIKLNKRSSSNITLDYGWGKESSHGFFMGMSEVF